MAGKLLAFPEKKICSMEFVYCLVENKDSLRRNRKSHTHTHTHTHKHKDWRNEMKFLQKQLNILQGLYKFIDKDCNWTEHIRRVERGILKVAVRYSVQRDETERGILRVEGA
jgi:hypothetical protein